MIKIKKEDIEKSNSWPFVEAKKILKERKKFIDKFNCDKKNGRDANIAILNHDNAVNKKAWWVFIDFKWSMLDKKNNIPKVIVIIPEIMNVESNSL